MDLMSRSGPMVQPTAALSWLRKPKAPTSLRSHGLNGGGAAFYLSGVTAHFFVGAAFWGRRQKIFFHLISSFAFATFKFSIAYLCHQVIYNVSNL
jgi:hypothetical protein